MESSDQSEIELSSEELGQHVQASLDETHRELAWIKTALIAGLYSALSLVNYFTLQDDMRLTATFFSLLVVVSFTVITVVHRLAPYAAANTNLVTFIEICILQADAIAFRLVTDDIMDGFGV